MLIGKNNKKVLKKALCLIFALIFSIESFGAVVSDNDGSAFITKGEFDSLKNSFQSQIDQYNTSIDSKIDGAISAYLAGIRVAKETILSLPIKPDDINNLYWFRQPKVYGKLRTWSNETTYSDTEGFVDPPHDDRWAFDANSEFRVVGNTIGLGGGVWWALNFSFNQTVDQRQTSRYYVLKGWDNWDHWAPTLLMRLQDTANYCRTRTNTSDQIWWRNYCNYCWGAMGSYNSEAFVRFSDNENQGWYWPYTQAFVASTNPNIPGVFVASTPGSGELLRGKIYFDANGVRNNNAQTGYFEIRVDARGIDLWPTWLTRGLTDSVMPYCSNYAKNPSSWNTVADHIPEKMISDGLHDFAFQLSAANQNNAWCRMMLGDDSDTKINITRYDASNWTLDGRNRRIVDKANYTDISCYVSAVNVKSTRTTWRNSSDASDVGAWRSGLSIPITLHVPGNEQMKVKEIENGFAKYTSGYLQIGQGIPISLGILENGDVNIKLTYTISRMVSPSGTQSDLRKILFDARKFDFLTGSTSDNSTYFDASIGDATTTAKSKNLELNVNAGNTASFTLHDVKADDQIWLRFKPEISDGGYYVVINSIEAKLTTGN